MNLLMIFFDGSKMLNIGKCTLLHDSHRYYKTKQLDKANFTLFFFREWINLLIFCDPNEFLADLKNRSN